MFSKEKQVFFILKKIGLSKTCEHFCDIVNLISRYPVQFHLFIQVSRYPGIRYRHTCISKYLVQSYLYNYIQVSGIVTLKYPVQSHSQNQVSCILYSHTCVSRYPVQSHLYIQVSGTVTLVSMYSVQTRDVNDNTSSLLIKLRYQIVSIVKRNENV